MRSLFALETAIFGTPATGRMVLKDITGSRVCGFDHLRLGFSGRRGIGAGGGGVYVFHAGYWGPHVGFYGGVNYGFGYSGSGFYGGRWEGGHFAYNTRCGECESNGHS